MTATVPRLADFLPYLLSVTTNAVSDLIAREYRAAYGLKIPEWRVMAVLGDAGARTQRELVDLTRMDKVAVNRACRIMAERGLIARSPNARDGRSHHLALTPAGQAMHEAIMPHAQAIETRLFAALAPDERAQLKDLLARLSAKVAELERQEIHP
jgi:DNA-binding MarR family transcriptional regulator